MFSSRRKEPPPSTHPFNTVWDIAGIRRFFNCTEFHMSQLDKSAGSFDTPDQRVDTGPKDRAAQRDLVTEWALINSTLLSQR